MYARAIAVDQPEPTAPIGGRSPVAVDENPVAEGVDDVGGDERESDDAHHVHGLQAAAHGEIEQQGKEADSERLGVGNGQRQDRADRCACARESVAAARPEPRVRV